MATSNTDQILIRKALSEREAGFQEIEKAGVLRRYLSEDAQEAWRWVERYQDENNGHWPGDEVLVYEMGWPMDHLEDFPEMTIAHCCKMIIRRTLLSEIDGLVTTVKEDLTKGKDFVFDARDKILNKVDSLTNIGTSGKRGMNIFHLYPKVLLNYDTYKSGKVGVTTPFETITESIRGWRPGSVNYICARPATGKTWLLLLNALVAHDQGLTVLFLSPELSQDELAERSAVMQAGLSYRSFTHGKLDFFAEKKLRENLADFSKMEGFWVIEDNMSFEKTEVEQAVRRFDPDVIAFDSMYLFGRGRNRSDQIADASPWLKQVAGLGRKRIVFATAQMNREAKNADTMLMSNIYGADTIAQDGDTIYAMFQDDSMSKDGIMGYSQLKVRNGMPHPPFFSKWDLESMVFKEIRESGFEDVSDNDPNPFSSSNY